MIVIACPGQGSQTPGFLSEWLDDPSAREFLGTVSDDIGVDLVTHGTVSDAETIRDTAIAQPLIVAASLLAWRALSARTASDGTGVAGHSVGEFAAAAIAGVMRESDAIRLVAIRGRAMAEAAARSRTGMAAVVGGDEQQVLEKISQHGLVAANRNGGGQIVAAGEVGSLQALSEDAPRGSRVIALQVAGAFHTDYMSSAIPELSDAASSVFVSDPVTPLWTNADGSRLTNGSRCRELLVSQVASPVRWDMCMNSFQDAGITGLIELTPAGALTGIAKRAMRGVPTVAVKSPADLDAAAAMLSGADA